MISSLIALAFVAAIDGPTVGPEEFLRLIEAQYEGIRELKVLAEGENRYLGDDRKFAREYPDIAGPNTYQGLFATRSDGATLTDIYFRGPGKDGSERPFRRVTTTLFRGFTETLDVVPDLKQEQFDRKKQESASVFDTTGSYCRICFLWYLRSLKDPVKAGYKQIGWENIDGHNCLVVEFAFYKERQREGDPTRRFWIDLERGGHPLRYVFFEDGKPSFSADQIVLKQFPSADGKRFWVPIAGQYTDFGSGPDYSTSGMFRETYSVVTGTVRINGGLPDDLFSARYVGGLDGTDEMKRMRQVAINVPKRDEARADPEGVKKNLAMMLTAADAQSKRLEASSAAQEVSGWTPVYQVALVGLGIILLGGIFYYKRKAG